MKAIFHITGGDLNIMMLPYQCTKSHYNDKTVPRPSYLHNEISYTWKNVLQFMLEIK